ncbi:MAG: phytanoyl-CoA dioxygenase family protein [Nitrospiraceae bacterium]|nr:phytanoyl-CoA dioxygenase family protein [Nitrospiraceae bacterium]
MTSDAGIDAFLPSSEDVRSYQRCGWYRSKRVLPDEVLDLAYAGIQRHFSGARDYILPATSGFSDWKPNDGAMVRNAEVVALQNVDVRKLALHPILGAIAARLTGSTRVRYFADTVVDKPGDLQDNESVVGWHTDLAYWQTCTSEALLTMWIPFQDCTLDMGPLLYVEGSHRWSGTDHLRTFRCKDLGELERRFPQHAPFKTVPMTLRRGELSVHHCRLIHGSGPNTSGRARVAFAVHLQDEANRFRLYRNEKGIPWHIFLDDLAAKQSDGTPDYSDPAVFPTIWPVSPPTV